MKKIKNTFNLFFSVLMIFMLMHIQGCASSKVMAKPDTSPMDEVDEAARLDEERLRIAEPEGDTFGTASTFEKRAPSAKSEGKPYVKRTGPSGLRAGFSDDNKQFNYFLNFLETYKTQVPNYTVDIKERIIFHIKDSNGKTVPNAIVDVLSGGKKLTSGKTFADGSFLFFPSRFAQQDRKYTVKIKYGHTFMEKSFARDGKRNILVTLDHLRYSMNNIPMDLVFILDTTGSMGEEIERLKKTIEIINLNLVSLSSKPAIRFGMILYRDKGDEYVTQTIPLTSNLQEFQAALNQVHADGGGDGPEDLQSALNAGIKELKWNNEGIRLGFIVTDAPPHLDYGQSFSYDHSALLAKEKGIKLFSVGTGGLNLAGEYILRQISQLTSAAYIFLTYGERGESEGGRQGSVSHHTGVNFQTDKLEAVILKLAKEELKHFSNEPVETQDDYFEAISIDDETRDQTLNKLFDRAVSQFVDYATYRITGKPGSAVLPIVSSAPEAQANAEYFTQYLLLAMSRSPHFTLVEREDMQQVISELKFQVSGAVDEDRAAEIGKVIGAKMLVTGKMYVSPKSWELFLKLIRVETAEVLAVTKLVVDKKLLLEN